MPLRSKSRIPANWGTSRVPITWELPLIGMQKWWHRIACVAALSSLRKKVPIATLLFISGHRDPTSHCSRPVNFFLCKIFRPPCIYIQYIRDDSKGYRQTETMGWIPSQKKIGCGGVHRTVFKLGPKYCSQWEVSAGTLKRAARITVANSSPYQRVRGMQCSYRAVARNWTLPLYLLPLFPDNHLSSPCPSG